MALNDLFNSWYLNTGRPKLALLQSVLDDLICPIMLAFPLGYFFGFSGMVTGLSAAPLLTVGILLAAVKKTHPNEDFPWLIEKEGGKYLTQTIELSEQPIMSFVLEMHDFLRNLSIESKAINRVELIAEETLLAIRDKNKGAEISAECFLRVHDDSIYFSIWDNGEIFNLMDEDAKVQSFRIYVTSNLLKLPLRKNNMVVMSFNRNVFTVQART